MATVTDEDFENFLDSELAWRRIELNALANHVASSSRANSTSPVARALTRGMITLLYAHWEGFCKSVFETYIKLVIKRKPLLTDAADSLVLAHVSHLIRRMDSGDIDAATELVGIARGGSSGRLRLAHDRIVDTKSNLRFAVFESIMNSLNIPVADFSTKRNLIDIQLCDHRNDIAHGRANFPKSGQVLDLHKQVIDMMETVRDLTIAQVRLKTYCIPKVASSEH
ncbi:hypothetical protein XU06_19895 [Rhodococcus erythropolis]|uniref:MAE_28990/MAE_18760 family HEPN-like nuclease n=1 Tax=Rhodococcus erythropolis TaxID=1833 RepID=UPI00061B7821|nr:hypothetical protein XU06_19895 [Rhodococcus erythropolis]